MESNILIVSRTYDWSKEDDLLKTSKKGLPGAENRFQWAIIKGLEYNLNKKISKINRIPIGAFPHNSKSLIFNKKIATDTEDSLIIDIGFLNLPLIKKEIQCLNIIKYTKIWYKKDSKNRKVIVYGANLENLKAISKIKKKYTDVEVILIVTDMPEFYEDNIDKMSFLQIIKQKMHKKTYSYMKEVDKFIILTEYMKDKLSIGKRPYIVIEGIAETVKNSLVHMDSMKKVILYAGALDNRYRIVDLVEGFMRIDNKNYELWICGEGNAKLEIEKKARIDRRIKYFGYVSKKVIDDLQNKATILVNPRPNKGDYVKYSFPSKILEYLIKGKPIICHKLDGVPNEYDNYLNYFIDDSIEGISKGLSQICEKSQDELDEIGMKGMNFAIYNKNHIVQTKKIINLIEN